MSNNRVIFATKKSPAAGDYRRGLYRGSYVNYIVHIYFIIAPRLCQGGE